MHDLVSSVFEKIVKESNSYRGNPNAVSSFVYTITRNKVIDYYRTRRKYEEISESLQSFELPEDDILKNEVLETLSVSLSFLPEDERKVIVFHY